MIRTFGMAAAMVVAASQAQADCGERASDIFAAESYSVERVEQPYMTGEGTEIRAQLRNLTGKRIKAVEGSVRFIDPLGRHILGLAVPEYPEVDPDAVVETSATTPSTTEADIFDNLTSENVDVFACVSAVFYADGTVERFPPEE